MRALIILLLLSMAIPAYAGSFRCENDIVYEGENYITLVKKCGKPDAELTRVITRTTPEGRPIYINVTEWIYDKNRGFYAITIIEGIITKIEFIYN